MYWQNECKDGAVGTVGETMASPHEYGKTQQLLFSPTPRVHPLIQSVCWFTGHGNMKCGTAELKDFASLPEHPDGVAFSEYIGNIEATSDMRHGQVYWGDYLTLHAVATVYRCEVVVVSSLLAATEPIIIRPLQGSVREERRVWLAHLHEYRYQSTRPGWPAVQVEQPAHRFHTPRASNLR